MADSPTEQAGQPQVTAADTPTNTLAPVIVTVDPVPVPVPAATEPALAQTAEEPVAAETLDSAAPLTSSTPTAPGSEAHDPPAANLETAKAIDEDAQDPPTVAQPERSPSEPLQPTSVSPEAPTQEVTMALDPASSAFTSTTTPSAPSAPLISLGPGPRRPKPPTKGILKPPPPPAKPTLGNRLRDMVVGSVNAVGGGAKSLFDTGEESVAAGPSVSGGGAAGGLSSRQEGPSGAVGTLNALSGRIGFGLSRLVANASGAGPTAGPSSGTSGASGMLSSWAGIANAGPSTPPRGREDSPTPSLPMSEKSRQKQPLKRATFVLPTLSITYPISSHGEPWSAKVNEDRQRIESTHRTLLSTARGPGYWTPQRLVALYESACRGREERPRPGIVKSLEALPNPPRARHIHLILADPMLPITIPLSHPSPSLLDTPLNRHASEALADVLCAEWALSDLRIENGAIESDDALKPVLHGLLVSGTLPTLSLAGNRKIKTTGWRLLAVFLKRARSLRYIDLSDTVWDKKSIDYLVQALTCSQVQPPPSPARLPTALPSSSPADLDKPLPLPNGTGTEDASHAAAYGSFVPPAPLLRDADDNIPAAVQTLRMDGCGLRPTSLEALAHGVRSSDVKHVSLRRNKISALGAVSLALMMRDYPDSSMSMTTSLSPTLTLSDAPRPASPTYTTYVSRARRGPNALSNLSDSSLPSNASDDPSLPPIPLVVSSAGVTSRVLPDGYRPPPAPKNPLVMPAGGHSAIQDGSHPAPPVSGGSGAGVGVGPTLSSTLAEGRVTSELGGASIALQRSVRALDGVERIGRLLTLDLKGNEIKQGVGYIAQVLKRNRTLKVLNLSDNKIEPAGLAVLAEALKYNSTLETLDLGSNPCSGPSLEGIAALRTSFTVNTSLKRLFLSDTNLTTEGAIALAEFIPENHSLLHLDLTGNTMIDKAGILAVSVGLKSNHLIRCLDISIPPNDGDLAELSQSILQSCIRNTESAAAALAGDAADSGAAGGAAAGATGTAASRAAGANAIWAPIKKSALVRHVKEADEARAQREREEMASSVQGVARQYVYHLKPERVVLASEDVVCDLQKWFEAGKTARGGGGVGKRTSATGRASVVWEPEQLPKEDFAPLLERARALRERVVEQIQSATESTDLEQLLGLNDALSTTIEQARGFRPPPRLLLPSQIVTAPTYQAQVTHAHGHAGHLSLSALGTSTGGKAASGRPQQSQLQRHQDQLQQQQAQSQGPTQPTRAFSARRHMRIPSIEISSPNFSIGDSDAESDAEEIDARTLHGRSGPRSPVPLMGIMSEAEIAGGSGGESGRRKGLQASAIGLNEDVSSGKGKSGETQTQTDKVNGAEAEAEAKAEADAEARLAEELAEAIGMTSPTGRVSRAWVEEEAEVFRKGTRLGVADEDEVEEREDVSGEQLKQEIMETEVPRSPARKVEPALEDETIEGEEVVVE